MDLSRTKIIVYIALATVVAVATCLIGVFFGFRWGQFQSALAENKLAIANLDQLPELNPQFREYLKARIYDNVRQFYPPDPGYRLQKDWDRGSVNVDVLGDVSATKDPTDATWTWQSANKPN